VSLSVTSHGASLPISSRLFLRQERATDVEPRRKGNLPEEIEFRIKPQIINPSMT
jgi:SRSO17 transposase